MANENNEQLVHFDIATPRGADDGMDGAGREPVRRSLQSLGGAGREPVHSGAGREPVQLRRAQGQPSTFNPERDRSTTPRREATLALIRGGSSPPERRHALGMMQHLGRRPDAEQFWAQCTEDALKVQQHRFEEVAASYMLETIQAFQTERAEWQRCLLAEEQRMAAHGRHEAEVERNKVEHQMMDAFRRHATTVDAV